MHSNGFGRAVQVLRTQLDARLQRTYLLVVSTALLSVGIVLAGGSFATSNLRHTVFGTPLGNDFAGFFVAAQILERGEASRLYDRELHNQLYHDLLPKLNPGDAIPYVHPPFVAGLLRPLTWLRYEAAVAAWLIISVGLFATATVLLLKSLPDLASSDFGLTLMLSLSFEPFLMECWLGGQLSAVGFLSYALAWVAWHRGRPFAAGMALGLSFYKPTLLVLVLPLLVIGRCWRVLAGMTITGVLLAGLSLAFVGWDVSVGYLGVLLSFRRNTTGSGFDSVVWKYVDLNNALRMLCGGRSSAVTALFLMCSLIPFTMLAKSWWRWPLLGPSQQQWLWAATLAWLPVLNLYVGIYDSIFVVQSILLAAGMLLAERRADRPLIDSGVAYWALTIAGSAWFSQHLARVSGVQVYTLALIGFGLFLLRRVDVTTTKPVAE
jgi:hypothetical protein